MTITNVDMLPDPVGRLSEFVFDPLENKTLTGDCGPTAATIAACAALGIIATSARIVDMVTAMQHHGWTDSNGDSNIGELANILRLAPYNLTLTNYGYSEPFTVDWHQLILDNAGVKPIIMELANGQALRDIETGSGENATNLHYHFICIVGKQSDGYIVADGDNFQVIKRFQIYPYATLAAARPCALIIVDMQRSIGSGGGSSQMHIPAGWTDDGTTLRAPNNPNVVQHAFRDYIGADATWDAANVPVSGDYAYNGGERQDFFSCSLFWTAANGVTVIENTDQVIGDLRNQLVAIAKAQGTLEGQLASANSQLATANAQVTSLTAQVAQLQAELAQAEQQGGATEKALLAQLADDLAKVVAYKAS